MSTYTWNEVGQNGERRGREREELEKRQAQRRQEVEQWRSRIPAWTDGARQCESLLVEARAKHAAAQAETARAWDALAGACFRLQGGEAHLSSEGVPILNNLHPEVGAENGRWQEAQEAEQRAMQRVTRLETERTHYLGLIGTARSMS